MNYIYLCTCIMLYAPTIFGAQKNAHPRDNEMQEPNRKQKTDAAQMTEDQEMAFVDSFLADPNSNSNHHSTTTSYVYDPMQDTDETVTENQYYLYENPYKESNKDVSQQIFRLSRYEQTLESVTRLEKLLKANPQVNVDGPRDENGNTALMFIIIRYKSDEALKEQPDLNINATNKKLDTIENHLGPNLSLWNLDLAEFSPQLKAIYLLLKAGADVNARNKEGFTPLLLATQYVTKSPQHYDNKLIRLLLAFGADVNAKNLKNESVIDFVLDDMRDITQELLKRGIQVDYSDLDLFFKVAQHGNLPLMKAFLDHGMGIETENQDGETALEVASASNFPNIAVIQELIARGADVNHLEGNDWPVLSAHLFSQRWEQPSHILRNAQVVKMLVDAGTNIHLQHEEYGKTMLMEFISWIVFEINKGIGFTDKEIEIIRTLLRGNKIFGPTDPDLQDAQGKTLTDYLRVEEADKPMIKEFKQAVIKEINAYNREIAARTFWRNYKKSPFRNHQLCAKMIPLPAQATEQEEEEEELEQ